VLDPGGSVRLVPPRVFTALSVRDRRWTVPGCWCPPDRGKINGHHLRHRRDGGATDLADTALLCPRHHTIVQQRGHTATVTAATVTWHLWPPRPTTRHARGDASARPDHS
jgi:hypothetical protein